MARKRKHKDTGSREDSSLDSGIKNKKQETQSDKKKILLTSRHGKCEEESGSPAGSARTRSAQTFQKNEESGVLQNVSRKQSSEIKPQTRPSQKSVRTSSSVVQVRNSGRLRSTSQGKRRSTENTGRKDFIEKKKERRKTNQTIEQDMQDEPKGKSVKTPDDHDGGVTKGISECTSDISCSSSNVVEVSADETSVTPDKGRRSSARTRKLTHKAAEATDSRRVKVQNKSQSPKKLEFFTDTENKSNNKTKVTRCDKSQSICDESSSTRNSRNLASSKTILHDENDFTNVSVLSITKTSESPADAHVHPAGTHVHPADTHVHPAGTHVHPACTHVHPAGTHVHPDDSSPDPNKHISMSVSENVIQKQDLTDCPSLSDVPLEAKSLNEVSPQELKSVECAETDMQTGSDHQITIEKASLMDSPDQALILPHAFKEINVIHTDVVHTDAGVQVSLVEDRGQLVSTGTQVDDGLAWPWQQVHLEPEPGDGVDLLRPESHEGSSTSSASACIDLNAMLSMSESEEKVLGGVSALIKDSLLQIHGMRQFVIHDLPSLTNIACFQTADKIAISGTIQGISRAWSILTNIEHNVHNKDPKSKKSVKIQWTGKNGIKKTVEFKKTPQSQNACLTETKPVKPVTVFVDVKSPEKNANQESEVESGAVTETGSSPQSAGHSQDNMDLSAPGANDPAPKKQISLLSGKSFSMSRIKIEGQIGVPVVSNSKERDSDKGGSGGDLSKTSYVITVAEDNQGKAGLAEETVDEVLIASKPGMSQVLNKMLVKKEEFDGGRSNHVRLGSQNKPVSDGGTQTKDGINYGDEDNCDNDANDNDVHSVVWHGTDTDNEVITVTKTGEYLCEQCPQVFASRPDLISHRWQTHKSDNTSEDPPAFVECTTCSQRFRCHLELQRHERRAHSLVSLLPKANPVSYTCNVCDKKFSEKRYLTTHLKRHTGIKRHCCQICGWRFFEAHKLKFHLETHKREEDRQLPYRCTICQRQYHNRQSWNDHMNTHTGSKPYTCNVCGTGFAHRIGLHRHKLTHEKECHHKCPYCSRGFKIKANLRAHMTIHTGVGKHTCPVCKKVFTVATSLRRHKCQAPETREDESGEGPYMFMCGVCNMTFPTLAKAEAHSITHVDGTTGDMSLVGVQVEEVRGETNILNSDQSTTYIIESDSSGKSMFISSLQSSGDGDDMVDEVEKIHIAASTLADLSTLSKDAESYLPGKETPAATSNFLSTSEKEMREETGNITELVEGTDIDKSEVTPDLQNCPEEQM